MRRILVSVAVLMLLAAPALANDGMRVTRWPEVPQGTAAAGDIIISAVVYDGTEWHIVMGATFQDHPLDCGPVVGPERPVG